MREKWPKIVRQFIQKKLLIFLLFAWYQQTGLRTGLLSSKKTYSSSFLVQAVSYQLPTERGMLSVFCCWLGFNESLIGSFMLLCNNFSVSNENLFAFATRHEKYGQSKSKVSNHI